MLLAVDHDHKTGAPRGLLCHTCNAGIGHLHDDPELILKAYYYVTGFKSSNASKRTAA
jgi:hypothetical protein